MNHFNKKTDITNFAFKFFIGTHDDGNSFASVPSRKSSYYHPYVSSNELNNFAYISYDKIFICNEVITLYSLSIYFTGRTQRCTKILNHSLQILWSTVNLELGRYHKFQRNENYIFPLGVSEIKVVWILSIPTSSISIYEQY